MAMRDARNSISTQLMSVSNTLCGEYEQSLKEKSSNISFGLGTLATAFGGAGAIFTNGTSSILSGLAGVTSGVNAEYNKDFFQGLASSIIIPGIEKQRTALAQTMANNMCFGITTYPLPLAIADVIRYHNACTMDKGVAATSQSISQSSSIGLDTLQNTLLSIENIHKTLVGSSGSSGSSGANKAVAGTQPGQGNPGIAAPSGGLSTQATPGTAPASTTQPPLGAEITLTQCQPLDGNGVPDSSASGAQPQSGPAGQQLPLASGAMAPLTSERLQVQ
jgi:hypothetical protein